MGYEYRVERPKIFREENQKMFLAVRDNAHRLCKLAGVATMEKIISGQAGDSWEMLACVDRLVELGELVEIPNSVCTAGQYRIFASNQEN